MQRARHLLLSLACLGPAACSDGGGARSHVPRSIDDRPRTVDDGLCPSCMPLVGGDTSDFGGGGGGCTPDGTRALSPDEAQALLDGVQGMLGTFEASVGWVAENGAQGQGEPEALFPPAILRATVERSGEPELVMFRQSHDADNLWSCPHYPRLPIRLAVEISDGTLRAELRGHLHPDLGGAAGSRLQAHGDLAAATGTLDLKLGDRAPLHASLHADWTYLDEFAGVLYIEGYYLRTYTPLGFEPAGDAGDASSGSCDAGDGDAGNADAGDGDAGDAGCDAGPPIREFWEGIPVGPMARFPFER